jgi:hypothetical protein
VDSLVNPTVTVNTLYPLANYKLRCTANIYYRTRCADDAPSDRLYYSSSQQNSVCRTQRLQRINSCLNSTAQLTSVPCLISVSSGMVTTTTATCTDAYSSNSPTLTISGAAASVVPLITPTLAPITQTPTITSTAFSSSDQSNGHVYRISYVYSQNYSSSRKCFTNPEYFTIQFQDQNEQNSHSFRLFITSIVVRSNSYITQILLIFQLALKILVLPDVNSLIYPFVKV